MRVKVGYTMNYDEVPNLVRELLDSCQQDVTVLSKRSLTSLNAADLLERIADFRQQLAYVESRLSEVENMVVGYETAMAEHLTAELEEMTNSVEASGMADDA